MRKFKFGSIILGTMLVMSVEANAYTVDLAKSKTELTAGDKIVVTVKLKSLEEEIDTYQAKLVYDSNYFKTVTKSDFELKNGWTGLTYNSNNGIFVVENDEKSKQNQEVLKVTLESKADLETDELNISLVNNLVSGGTKDIETSDVSIDIDVQKNEYGYFIEDGIMTRVKPKTPVADFKGIVKNSKNRTVEVLDNGKVVTSGYVKTGMMVKITENNATSEYTISVIGDPNGDGLANSIDTKMIKAYRNEILSLSGASFKAADIDNNGQVNLKDSKLLLYHRADIAGYNLNYSK